jgi:small conductance mechanosensitive channel
MENFAWAFDYAPYAVAIGILLTTWAIGYVFDRVFNRFILKSTLVLKNDPTNYKFLKHTIKAVIYLVGIALALSQIEVLRTISSSILAGAGILAVAVGFASQHALSNVVSGVFIVIFKPYRINDRIVIKDTLQGIVEDITLRHTVIRDFQNRRIVIPNTIISNEIIVNADLTDEKVCRFIEIGISYGSDIKKAKEIMREETLKHPLLIDNRTPEQIAEGADQVSVRVLSLGESAVLLRAWAWAANQADAFVLQCDLLESIKERFDAEGIEIPFPHRTLYIRNDWQAKPETPPPGEEAAQD